MTHAQATLSRYRESGPAMREKNDAVALQFEVQGQGSTGNVPQSDGWTYHHILPVRYYWVTAVILAKVIRFMKCTEDQSSLREEFGIKAKRGESGTGPILLNRPAQPTFERSSPGLDVLISGAFGVRPSFKLN